MRVFKLWQLRRCAVLTLAQTSPNVTPPITGLATPLTSTTTSCMVTCNSRAAVAFGYKPAVAGASGQEPLLGPRVPFHNRTLPRRHGVFECLSFHRRLGHLSR
jgi:hypothetical protein